MLTQLTSQNGQHNKEGDGAETVNEAQRPTSTPIQHDEDRDDVGGQLESAAHEKVDVEIRAWDEGARVQRQPVVTHVDGEPEKELNESHVANVASAKEIDNVDVVMFVIEIIIDYKIF